MAPKPRSTPKEERNFWIIANVDDRATEVSFGPAESDGGFTLTIYQLEDGQHKVAATLIGYLTDKGQLQLSFAPHLEPHSVTDVGVVSIKTYPHHPKSPSAQRKVVDKTP